MPDKRQHRGPHPQDAQLFAEAAWPDLRRAVHDLSWLLSNRYSPPSSLTLVGDRYRLTERQRHAVMRCAAGEEAVASRRGRQLSAQALRGQPLAIDGYNVLTTVEAALSGGLLLLARDGCLRDLAQMSHTYHRVSETEDAIRLLGEWLSALGVSQVHWYLDSPVSNSGRLSGLLRHHALERDWPWTVELVPNPDPVLSRVPMPVTTADSVILDRCQGWYNLVRDVVEREVTGAWIVDLR